MIGLASPWGACYPAASRKWYEWYDGVYGYASVCRLARPAAAALARRLCPAIHGSRERERERERGAASAALAARGRRMPGVSRRDSSSRASPVALGSPPVALAIFGRIIEIFLLIS